MRKSFPAWKWIFDEILLSVVHNLANLLIISCSHNFDFCQSETEIIRASKQNFYLAITTQHYTMVTSSKMAAATAFLLTMTAADAYRITYRPVVPSRAIRRSSPNFLTRQSYFPSDLGRMMDDVDELFDSVLGDVNDMFNDASPFQRISRPTYSIDRNRAVSHLKRPANTYSITQDEKQVKMVVSLPGAKASDVNLDLNEENRTLKISGETTFENEGISFHSTFDKTFTLDRNLDMSEVAAEFDSGVLTITAPKFETEKDSVRRIDILDNSSSGEEVNHDIDEKEHNSTGENTNMKAEAETSEEEEDALEANESVIDLDDTNTTP